MSPERTSALVGRWVRRYTRDLPAEVAERRSGEIAADLHDHVAHGRAQGAGDTRVALDVLSRMVRGLPADVSWRDRQVRANLEHPATLAAARRTRRAAYGSGLLVALGSAFMLFFVIGALGLIGVEGDIDDRMYLAVFATLLVGALVARLRPDGMARTLAAMAVVQTAIALIAVAGGRHEDPVTSLGELLGLNAMFVVLFLASAWLFRQAARYPR